MIWGIASYKRPECRTLRTLLEAGVNREDIVVSTQCVSDYEEYKKRHNVRILYRETDCAAGNRNTILDEYKNEDVLLLDDDITSFFVFKDCRYLKDDKMFVEKIPWMFKFSRENGATVFGISATDSNLVRLNRYQYDFKVLLQGTVLGINRESKILFDERFKMLEDYELSIRASKRNGYTMRFNDFCAGKPKNGTNEGGLHERYENRELKHWVEVLCKFHREFKPNKTRTGGMAVFDRREM